MIVTAADKSFDIDAFPAPSIDIALKMRAMIVKANPMSLWDPALGDNFVHFRIQFLILVRERNDLMSSSKKSLEAYLMKLDSRKHLHGCCEVVPVEEPEDPQNLPRKVGEHPEVLIRLLVLHAGFNSGLRQSSKLASESVPANATMLNLLWWVFVKEAYQRTEPSYLAATTKLFAKYEKWLLPLVKEHWDADPRRAADIIMPWFVAGITRDGLIVRHADQRNHATLRQIYAQGFGIELPLEFLKYGMGSNLVPIYEPMKSRVTVSALSLLYYMAKDGKMFNNPEIIEVVIRTLAMAFTSPDYYTDPEAQRPKGYYGMYKMGMEILSATSQPVLEKAILRSRADVSIASIQETVEFLVGTANQHAVTMIFPPQDAGDEEAIRAEGVRGFIDSASGLRNLLDFLSMCTPRDAALRSRLRHHGIISPICTLINFFTEKPDNTNIPRGSPRRLALFSRVPAGSRATLVGFLDTAKNFLNLLFKAWPSEEKLTAEMTQQRDKVLDLSLEAEVASEMVAKVVEAWRRVALERDAPT
ncbi:hypothetical protein ABW21_db0207843 [Orbilia brochopaga]|nr:hypothetical protein ABW21_db0207843 [Drechslerella brochopaga]